MEKIGDLRREEKISRKTVKGFTLLELIVAMAIIGILAAISSGLITGYVRDRKFETCNEYARLVYTATQNSLIQSEIKQDTSMFDAKYMGGSSSTPSDTLSYVALTMNFENGEIARDLHVTVNSYYGSSTNTASVSFAPSHVWDYANNKAKSSLGSFANCPDAFKFYRSYIENGLAADFTGTCQIYIDMSNYLVDAVVYNDFSDNTINYLNQWYFNSGTAKSQTLPGFMGVKDIYTQRSIYKANGEYFGCYPMLNDVGTLNGTGVNDYSLAKKNNIYED